MRTACRAPSEASRRAARKWRENNREKFREIQRRWKAENPHRRHDNHLRAKYGITLAEYEAMERACGGKCQLCGKPPSGRRKRLCVDHCHDSGRVRGLLCQACNAAIGLFDDSPELMKKAAEYVVATGLKELAA